MNSIQDLHRQRAELDAQIAAAKPQAVAQVVALMEALGVTWEDLGVVPLGKKAAPAARRAVKYRDERGNTWTGVGQRPVWLRERILAGATLDQFKVG